MTKIAVVLIEIYQKLFSFDKGVLRVLAIGGACKFSPTCSEYTKQQILKHGLVKGSWLGMRRILKCI